MYPVSSAVKALFYANNRQVLRISGTDRNGATISITDANVMQGGFSIDRYSCNGKKLEIGTAIASELKLKLDNRHGQFSGIVFEGAELCVEIGIADWSLVEPEISYISCGYFTPDEQPRGLNTISLNALDRMMRFDETIGTIVLPATIASIVTQCAVLCTVPFTQDISGLPNSGYVVSQLPDVQQDLTYRMLIQWCAGIMGCNAWINWNGALNFSWYGAATGYNSTIENRFSSEMYEDDIQITGVQYTNTQGATIVSGSADYALDLTGNYLAANGIATILPNIRDAVNGFTYRPFSANAMNAPYLWPMDAVTFTDKGGNDHASVLTNVNFGINGATGLASKGETEQVNSKVAPHAMTAEQAFLVEKAMQSAIDTVDESLTQEDIFNRLTDNGQAQGLYMVNGQLYFNGSYLRAGEINADVVRIINLSVSDIDTGLIHSADYETVVIPKVYPTTTLYPAANVFPNYGERVIRGFAIDFATGQIYGAFYSDQIEDLQDAQDEMSGDIVDLQTTVSGLGTNVSQLQTAVSGLQSTVSNLQDAITALQNALVYPKALPTRMAMFPARNEDATEGEEREATDDVNTDETDESKEER